MRDGSPDTAPANYGAGLRLGSGLLLTPVLVTIGLGVLPSWPASDAVASLVSFAAAAGVALASLAIGARAEVSLKTLLGIGAAAALTLGLLAYWPSPSRPAWVAVDAALVALALTLGTAVGRRVQHAGHLLPACVVAASADVVSLLSPEGPSHAVITSERALSMLAVWFPVPGTRAVAPALGVGDLLFIAFVLSVATAHGLVYFRAVVCCASGVAAAGLAAATLRVAVPALVPIAAAAVIGMPAIRRLRAVDRRPAYWSMLVAVALAVATLARSAVALLASTGIARP
jgi:hypothetical protein